VTDLVNTPAVMVGHDLEVTALPSEFPVDLLNGRNLITRSLSRGVVADCFEHSKPGSVHSIVGAPGIGKSWNLIYALQQALLFENVCVIFFFEKKWNLGFAFERIIEYLYGKLSIHSLS
jgi:hypothetical protein